MEKSSRQQLSRTYAPAVLQRLDQFPTKDQLPIAAWLVKTPVGTNYALQILTSLEDLSRKEGQAPSQCLTGVLAQMGEIPDQPKEVGRQVRDCLARKLKPESSAYLDAFEAWVGELQLPRGVRLIPPKNFEGRDYRVELSFQDLKDLALKVNGLVQSLQQAPWEEIEKF